MGLQRQGGIVHLISPSSFFFLLAQVNRCNHNHGSAAMYRYDVMSILEKGDKISDYLSINVASIHIDHSVLLPDQRTQEPMSQCKE